MNITNLKHPDNPIHNHPRLELARSLLAQYKSGDHALEDMILTCITLGMLAVSNLRTKIESGAKI